MAFHNVMQHLTGDLLAAYDARVIATMAIQSDTHQMLSQFNATLRDLSALQRHNLQGHMRDLQTLVASQRHQATQCVTAQRSDHMNMAAQQRQHLDEFARALRASTAASLADARRSRRDARAAHQASMNQFVGDLRESAHTIKRDTDEMMRSMAETQAAASMAMRSEMARARNQLAEDVAGTRQSIEAERTQLRDDQATAQGAWQAYAHTMRDRRTNRP